VSIWRSGCEPGVGEKPSAGSWSVVVACHVAPLDVYGSTFGPIVRPIVSAATAAPKLAAAFAVLTDLRSRRNFRSDPAGNRCPLAFLVRVSCP
jgi:hypothetical protein